MIVILKEDVKGLGKKGERVKVADGYGRNFLLPRQLAFEADSGALQELEVRETQKAQKGKRDLERARRQAAELEGTTLIIRVKHGGGGKLFGAITNIQIAEELMKQKGIEIDRKRIEMKENIKMIGHYEVILRIYPEVTAKINVNVHPLEGN